MNSFVKDIFETIAKESSRRAHYNKNQLTITSPGELQCLKEQRQSQSIPATNKFIRA